MLKPFLRPAPDLRSQRLHALLLPVQILDGKDGPAIETPLDGTQYDLKTGQVRHNKCGRIQHPIQDMMRHLPHLRPGLCRTCRYYLRMAFITVPTIATAVSLSF